MWDRSSENGVWSGVPDNASLALKGVSSLVDSFVGGLRRPRRASETDLSTTLCSAEYLSSRAHGLASLGGWCQVVAIGHNPASSAGTSTSSSRLVRRRGSVSSVHSVSSTRQTRSASTASRWNQHREICGDRLGKKLEEDVTIVFAVVGATGSGKTSLVKGFVGNREEPKAVGSFLVDQAFHSQAHATTMRIGDKLARVQIWDVAGLEDTPRQVAERFLSSVNGIIFCFDVTDRASLEQVSAWYNIARRAVRRDDVTMYLFANKIDRTRHRKVSLEEALVVAHRLNLRLFEASVAGNLRGMLRQSFEAVVLETVDRQIGSLKVDAVLRSCVPFEPLKGFRSAYNYNMYNAYNRVEKKVKRSLWHLVDVVLGLFGIGCSKKTQQPVAHPSVAIVGVQDMIDQLAILAASHWMEIGALEVVRFVSMQDVRRSVAHSTLRRGEVKCPQGCGEILSDRAEEIQQHLLQDCVLRKVPCPLQCGEKVVFSSIKLHVQEQCAKRVLHCQICSQLHDAGVFAQHQTRWAQVALALWTESDVCHFLHDELGAPYSQQLIQLDASVTGKALLSEDVRASIGSKLGIDLESLLESYLRPYARFKSETDPAQHQAFVPSSKKTTEANHIDDIEVPVRESSVTNPLLLAGIHGFDRRSLKKPSEEPVEQAQQQQQEQQRQVNSLLSGIQGFKRDQLKKAVSVEREIEEKKGNGLMAGILGFDRSKLKHADKKDTKTTSAQEKAPLNGNPLMSALAAALDKRRQVLETDDESEEE